MIVFAVAALLLSPDPAAKPVKAAPPPPPPAGVSATVSCTAFADGRIGECRVVRESHPGLGFGAAAVALMEGSSAERSARDARFERTIQFTR